MRTAVEEMAGTLRRRGPDDADAWVDPEAGVAFGHQRLSIIDLSSSGRQPMVSRSGRYVVTYNGEIYNFGELRDQLSSKGERFRGTSDTEVMLAAFEQWGVPGALVRMNGMFAFGLWDRRDRKLTIARDRIGEKPLYYGWSGRTFLFGSELKALRAHPRFAFEIDRRVLALFLRHDWVPAPYSIYAGIFKLPPGTLLSVAPGGPSGSAEPSAYWSLGDVAAAGANERRRELPLEHATEELESLLSKAVADRMYADVPIGAFLSGGIDSSTIVALMQAQSPRPVRTFTIGFSDPTYDESAAASAVAHHLGTDHTELRVTPLEVLDVVPSLPAMYDEPFADPSQIPTFLVSRMARKDVTVSLSGDGGDELFGGYNKYFWCEPIWRRIGWAPLSARRLASDVLGAVPPRVWNRAFDTFSPLLPPRARVRMPSNKVQKLADVLTASGLGEMHFLLASRWKDPASVVIGGTEAPSPVVEQRLRSQLTDPIEQMMYADATTSLPDDMLVKVDRATMAVSLEARVPFLDHRVIELAWRLPLAMKVREGQGKWLLRQVLYRYVPPELVERPKMGFDLPIDTWLRGPLRSWAEGLLDPARLRREGFFRAEPIRRVWNEHRSGRRDWQYHLWNVLMFQAWWEAEQASSLSAVA
jgi:asparagine synthase (glutamine-hydrolysing)